MIVVVCMDDVDVLDAGKEQSREHPEVYGSCYHAFFDAIPKLGRTENLYISAHGTDADAQGTPVIGNHADDIYDFSGKMLYKNIESIFPYAYAGNIYISACHSADIPKTGKVSFITAFKLLVQQDFPAANVYGAKGEIPLDIFTPNSPNWVKA